MNRDRQEELERLEKELLEEIEEETPEEDEALLDEEDTRIGDAPAVYQNFANNYGKDLRNFASGYKAYNSDRVDEDLEQFSKKVLEEEKPTVPVWVLILLVALIGAVVGAILWIYLSLGGLK